MIKQSEKKVNLCKESSSTQAHSWYVHFNCVKKDSVMPCKINYILLMLKCFITLIFFVWRVENWDWIVHVTNRLTNVSLDTYGAEANYTIWECGWWCQF